jgi:hypothetical protein
MKREPEDTGPLDSPHTLCTVLTEWPVMFVCSLLTFNKIVVCYSRTSGFEVEIN